nr:DUF1508 domain-containing protein [Arthrobacter sp. Soil736]
MFQAQDGPLPFGFRLRTDDGVVVARSRGLDSIDAVKGAIMAVRESAATGLVVDMTGSAPGESPPPASRDGA